MDEQEAAGVCAASITSHLMPAADLLQLPVVPKTPKAVAPPLPRSIAAIQAGKMTQVMEDEADYEPLYQAQMYTDTTNMVPLTGNMKGARTFLASKMWTQAMPMAEPEAPLVDAIDEETGGSWSQRMGSRLGVRKSPIDGTVLAEGR